MFLPGMFPIFFWQQAVAWFRQGLNLPQMPQSFFEALLLSLKVFVYWQIGAHPHWADWMSFGIVVFNLVRLESYTSRSKSCQ